MKREKLIPCRVCEKIFHRSEYYFYKNGNIKRICKGCRVVDNRRYWVRKKLKEFDAPKEVLPVTNGHCEICGGHSKQLRVDHDHETNLFRGLLCASCNLGLGLFQDDPSVLEKAREYLNKKGQKPESH